MVIKNPDFSENMSALKLYIYSNRAMAWRFVWDIIEDKRVLYEIKNNPYFDDMYNKAKPYHVTSILWDFNKSQRSRFVLKLNGHGLLKYHKPYNRKIKIKCAKFLDMVVPELLKYDP